MVVVIEGFMGFYLFIFKWVVWLVGKCGII